MQATCWLDLVARSYVGMAICMWLWTVTVLFKFSAVSDRV